MAHKKKKKKKEEGKSNKPYSCACNSQEAQQYQPCTLGSLCIPLELPISHSSRSYQYSYHPVSQSCQMSPHGSTWSQTISLLQSRDIHRGGSMGQGLRQGGGWRTTKHPLSLVSLTNTKDVKIYTLYCYKKRRMIISISLVTHQRFLSWHNQKGRLCFQLVLGEKVSTQKTSDLCSERRKIIYSNHLIGRCCTNLCIGEDGFSTSCDIG